jgi:SAM-dependent methyltransferase
VDPEGCGVELGHQFGSVADSYDEIRPEYPAELYDALEAAAGAVAGRVVLDLAAGTGLQTRALLRRGAHVVATDLDIAMLQRLRSITAAVPVIVAAGERLPLRDDSVDLVVCATAWHWMNTEPALDEARRVLRPGGYLALWWANNRWGDGVEWEDAQSAVFDRWDSIRGSVAPPTIAGAGPRDAATDLRTRGVDVVLDQEFNWTREVTREQHLRLLATHSDHLIRPRDQRRAILAELETALAPWPVVTERLWGPLIVAQF